MITRQAPCVQGCSGELFFLLLFDGDEREILYRWYVFLVSRGYQ